MEYLQAAKATLGMQWDEVAQAAGIEPRAFKNYRLPEGSKGHRNMPRLARDAIESLLKSHARKNRRKAA
ncbi:hypothetical protein [Variovorax rhizosphaerae]|uniref:Transcriptional regulator n=1 Tax=Variovorax rhizosphaerae TaxID=1836200 RepID=A0ABU8WZC5_9BURK